MKHETLLSIVRAAIAVMLMLLLAPAPSARAAGIVVNSTDDTTVNDDGCTLREAITNANDNAQTWSDCTAGSGTATDKITFNFSGTIRLNSALPNITDMAGLTIDGAGQSVTISGDSNGDGTADVRMFVLSQYSSLTLQNLSLTKGNAGSGYGGAIYNDYQGTVTVANSTLSSNEALIGGAIANDRGTVAVTNSVFSGNSTTGSGGAISSGGPMTITNSTFAGNSASDDGGAVLSGDTLAVVNSTFSGNSTSGTGWGGGIFNNGGALAITGSTFSGNTTTTYGGGIADNFGPITVTNSTFSNNSASLLGGGIYVNNLGMLLMTNSTLADNSAAGGFNLFNNNFNPAYTVTLRNTIVASAFEFGSCGGTITNGGHNIDTHASCAWSSNNGSMSNTNPLLGPLANNGGPTQTRALQPGSPAIDAGNATICALLPPDGPGGVDQRGTAHKGVCDIGAFEFGMKLALPALFR